MVMDTLGIDVDAEASDNMKTFKKITVQHGHKGVHVRRFSRLVSNAEQAQRLPRNGSLRRLRNMRIESSWKTRWI